MVISHIHQNGQKSIFCEYMQLEIQNGKNVFFFLVETSHKEENLKLLHLIEETMCFLFKKLYLLFCVSGFYLLNSQLEIQDGENIFLFLIENSCEEGDDDDNDDNDLKLIHLIEETIGFLFAKQCVLFYVVVNFYLLNDQLEIQDGEIFFFFLVETSCLKVTKHLVN